LRRRQEQALDEEESLQVADDADTPEVVTAKLDMATLIRACVDRLPAEQQVVMDLVYYHEQSVKEVSEVLGIPESTVKTRMFYARKKLSEMLKAVGVDRGWP
jgi:RNA polymerase sigma-70 factor (ECF subfamily)